MVAMQKHGRVAVYGALMICSSVAIAFAPESITSIDWRRKRYCGSGHEYAPPRYPMKHQPRGPLNAMYDDGESEMSSSRFSMEEVPLNQIFKKAVVLQRSGDRLGALDQYAQFLKVALSHDVDPSLYAEVHANMGAIYAMQGKGSSLSIDEKIDWRTKAKDSFREATKYRPSLGSAWVNLALLILAEGKDMGNSDPTRVENALKEARQCCERAMGMDNEDEQSRALANKLIGDIDSMMRQTK